CAAAIKYFNCVNVSSLRTKGSEAFTTKSLIQMRRFFFMNFTDATKCRSINYDIHYILFGGEMATQPDVDVVVVGGGQAGIAMSEHLTSKNISHVVLERERIAERWRTGRWDSLVANGPAWHDRFP